MKTFVALVLAVSLFAAVSAIQNRAIPVRQRLSDLLDKCGKQIIKVVAETNPDKPPTPADVMSVIKDELDLPDILSKMGTDLAADKGDDATWVEETATDVDCVILVLQFMGLDAAAIAGERACMAPDASAEVDEKVIVGCIKEDADIVDAAVDTISKAADDDYSAFGIPLLTVEAGIIAISNGLDELRRMSADRSSKASRELDLLLRELDIRGPSGGRPKPDDCGEDEPINLARFVAESCPVTQEELQQYLPADDTPEPLTVKVLRDAIAAMKIKDFTDAVRENIDAEDEDFLEKEWETEACKVMKPLFLLSIAVAAANTMAPPCSEVTDLADSAAVISCLTTLVGDTQTCFTDLDSAISSSSPPEELAPKVLHFVQDMTNIAKSLAILQDNVTPAKRDNEGTATRLLRKMLEKLAEKRGPPQGGSTPPPPPKTTTLAMP